MTNLTVVNREQLPRAAASLAASGSPIGSCSLCMEGSMGERTSNAICAWCGCELPPVDGIAAGEVTHGICKECFEREMAKAEEANDGNAT